MNGCLHQYVKKKDYSLLYSKTMFRALDVFCHKCQSQNYCQSYEYLVIIPFVIGSNVGHSECFECRDLCTLGNIWDFTEDSTSAANRLQVYYF